MHNAVIVDAIRSPVGRAKPGSLFADLHPVELLRHVIEALVKRNDLDPGSVDDVLTGCVSQVGEQSFAPGRMAWLGAGFPEHVPATTIDRKCGSSQQAVHFAAQGVMAGAYDIVIACGVESMSRVPMGSARLDRDIYGPSVTARYSEGLVSQGVASELIGAQWGVDRAAVDAYAARSHQRAEAAASLGQFTREIIPIRTASRLADKDETIRAGTTAESLSGLKPVFRTDADAQRFPGIQWSTTAGNSSQMSDGAAGLLIMSEQRAKALGLKPRARFVAFDACGDSPVMMLTAPIASTRRALKKGGLTLNQVDHYEVNEAFAQVPLAWQKEFDADGQRLNPRGGAIALGHPLGASGARVMTTMLHALEDGNLRYGLQTMCEAGGMANTTIIERL
ncbi:thiolase family protein [Hydrogenophaga sp.]|uniref:thiolase family protein n=1 Tax=Hydrogenophaga sp. TaxID=1904254 RepID=UPI00271C7C34|nr:thiolase family protein [Hydrogenophaga sp.]MDO9435900.1 thiolase family protein [Hydrogenophaga sp.]